MAKGYVFLADGFEEVEGLTAVDLLRRAGIETEMVSISNTLAVKGSHEIQVQADLLFEESDYADADFLLLPGGMPGTLNLGKHEGLCSLLKKKAEAGKRIAAICAAPSVLGALGILEGKEAVCYPGFEEQLHCRHTSTEEVKTDGNVTTSRGVGTAIPFALELISQICGAKKAEEIKKSILYMQ